MARVGMTAEAVKEFQKPVAKKKVKQRERRDDDQLADKHSKHVGERRRPSGSIELDRKHASPVETRGVMQETMARVYEEMWPSMTVRNEFGDVDIEIQEETYILSLAMFVGTPHYMPRRGLKIREDDDASSNINFCADHN